MHVLILYFNRLRAAPVPTRPHDQAPCLMTLAIQNPGGGQIAIRSAIIKGQYVLAPGSAGQVRIDLSFTAPTRPVGHRSWSERNTASALVRDMIDLSVDTTRRVWSECGESPEVRFAIDVEARASTFTPGTLVNLVHAEAAATVSIERRTCTSG